MSGSQMNYEHVEYQLQSVHASLRALIQDVCYGPRGRIASAHLTKALTEVITALRHVNGQHAIDQGQVEEEIAL